DDLHHAVGSLPEIETPHRPQGAFPASLKQIAVHFGSVFSTRQPRALSGLKAPNAGEVVSTSREFYSSSPPIANSDIPRCWRAVRFLPYRATKSERTRLCRRIPLRAGACDQAAAAPTLVDAGSRYPNSL